MLLDVRGLESGYGKVTILHGIDLTVDAGEIVVVLGPNGAGKSTLLKTIAGHLSVTVGEVLLDGARIDSTLDAAGVSNAGVGYVPQEGNVFGRLSVLENLNVGALGRPDQMDEAVETALKRFPILRDRAGQRASTLSGGERQILAISSAIMLAPRLILLDEPTSGLSPVFVGTIVDWIVELVAGVPPYLHARGRPGIPGDVERQPARRGACPPGPTRRRVCNQHRWRRRPSGYPTVQ